MIESENNNETQKESVLTNPSPKTELSLSNSNQTPAKYKFKTDSGLFWVLLVFCMFFVSFIFTFQVILTPIKVIGTSMQPTINKMVTDEKDDVHADIVYFKSQNSYTNNDIVIVSNANDKYISSSDDEPVEMLIKRVIAKAGQSIKFSKDNSHPLISDKLYYTVTVLDENGNNINLDQSYLDEEMFYTYNEINVLSRYTTFYEIFSAVSTKGSYTLIVPENSYFVMGDNRNDSGDSRLFGSVLQEDICGKVKLIVPYGKNMFVAIWTTIFSTKQIILNFQTKFILA